MFGFGFSFVPTVQENDDPAKWRDRKTAAQCLHFLCLSEHLADMWFNFDDCDVRLPAHKFVLSMRSEVFENMFYGQPGISSSEIHIDDVSSDIMERVFRYMYTDLVEINKDNVFGLLHVAKKYDLKVLQEACIQNLIKSVEATSACGIYEKVQGYDLEERVSKACLEYIWRHAWKVFKTDDFLKISRTTLAVILGSDNLTGDEISTFRAILKWARHQATENNEEATPLKLQEYIGDAVSHIRFPLMTIEEFKEEVEPSGVLAANDITALHRYIQEKDLGLKVEMAKFKCKPRNGGVMVETINNAYPFPDKVPGGIKQKYNILFMTTADIRLHSMTGPLAKEILSMKMCVQDRSGPEYQPPSVEILDKEDLWQTVKFAISKNEEILFLDEPIIMPHTYTYVRMELVQQISAEKPEDTKSTAPAPGGLARGRGRHRKDPFPVAYATNMSLIIKNINLSLSEIPPGITHMSFR